MRASDPALVPVPERAPDSMDARELPDLIETWDAGPPAPSKAPRAPLQLTHYEVGERLGGGGAGVVYRAIDRRTQEVVALKLLHPSAVAEERSVLRFRREFRSVSRLDHPNCVRVLDEGVEGPHRFFTMEHVAGGDMQRLIGAPRDVVLAALVQVAGALDYIHGHRIVHRDLKPANVLLTLDEPPRPKLADFGIALDATQPRVTQSGMLVGTLAYLSPEQLHGETVDPRSDLYALGCMCWELFAGQPPRRPHDVMDAVNSQRTHPGRLRDRIADIPAALDELIGALLEPVPKARPASALEVMHTLVEVLAAGAPETAARLLARVTSASNPSISIAAGASAATSAATSAAASLDSPLDSSLSIRRAPSSPGTRARSRSFLYQPPLIGRTAEMARLRELGQQVGDGGPSVPTLAVLRGPAGRGKSLLASEAIAELRRAGVHTVVARIEPVGQEPLAALRTIASAVDRWTPRRAAGGQPIHGVSLEQLKNLAGNLVGGVWDTGSIGKATEPGAVQRRRAEQLAERLLAIAAVDRFAVVIEDLHDADAGTRALLASVLDRLSASPGPRPLLLATCRDGAALLEGRDDVEWIELSALDDAGVQKLCAGMLGVGESGVPSGLAGHAAAISDGNPLAVRTFVHRLAEAGALLRVSGGWHADPAAMLEAVVDQIDLLLAQLTPPTRELLARAAVVGASFDVALLGDAFDRSPEQVMDAVDEALRATLLRPSDAPSHLDAYRFDHARFGEALAASLEPAQRSDAHERIGRALARRSAPPAVVAYHLHQGRDDRAAFIACRVAAESAVQTYDLDAAARYFRWALEHGEGASPEERDACAEGLADALSTLGHGAEAVTALRALHESGTDDGRAVAVRRQRKLGHALLLAGEVRAGITELQRSLRGGGATSVVARVARIAYDLCAARLRRALGLAPRPSPRLEAAALAHRELALLYRWIDLYGSARHAVTYLRLAERHGDTSLRVDAMAMYQVLLQWQGRHRRVAALDDEARALAATITDPSAQSQLALVQGLYLVLNNDLQGAIDRWSEAVSAARRAGDRARQCLALSSRGWAMIYRGEFEAAIPEFEHAQRAGGAELPWFGAEASAGHAYAEVWLGKLDDAVARADQVRDEAARMSLPALVALAGEVRAWRHYLLGDFASACTELASARALYRRHRLGRAWGYPAQFGHADALLWEVDAGRRDKGEAIAVIVDIARTVTRELGTLPMFRGLAEVLWGIVWARRGDARRAERLFTRAEEQRGGRSQWDAWATGRIAVERHRLGLAPERVAYAREALRRYAVLLGPGIATATTRFEDAIR